MEERISANYEKWLASARVSPEDKKILQKMSEKEKIDSFYTDMSFGTGGMRGILGPGTNRMNSLTIGRVSLAFGEFLLKRDPRVKEKGVVISHDNRYFSRQFTLETAKIMNDLGIKTYIFDDLRPTPELSFAVRYLGALGGVMITASHNPKEYNGYKIYDETGCQFVPEQLDGLMDILSSLPNELEVVYPKEEKPAKNVILGNEVDEAYIEEVLSCQINPSLPKKGFKVVYSPEHGASLENALKVFKRAGYEILPVESQCVHDPAFGGTLSPNPETAEAFIEPIKLAEETQADFCVVTDPDGDRCGVAYRSSKGSFERFTGNQSAALLLDYLLSERKRLGLLSSDGVMYDTIVSSDLARKVAKFYGLKVESFLTGFKYIGSRINYYEKLGKGPHFEFGYEESYGCLIKPFTRDKDGLQAILLYSEMALYYRNKGVFLDVAYKKLEERFGFHANESFSIAFGGQEGQEKMLKMLDAIHKDPFLSIAGHKVKTIEDCLTSCSLDTESGKKTSIDLPKSDVLKFIFEDSGWVAIRPSGTEPKCKFYVEVVQKEEEGIVKKKDHLILALKELIKPYL